MSANRRRAKAGVHVTNRLPAELVERLDREADERMVSRSLLVERAITRYLDALVPVAELEAKRDAELQAKRDAQLVELMTDHSP